MTKKRWPKDKRWPKLIGEGTWESPRIIIRWNGHEFGHLPTERYDILVEITTRPGTPRDSPR